MCDWSGGSEDDSKKCERRGGGGFLSDSITRPFMVVKSVKLSPIKGNRNILVRSSPQV